MQAELEREGIGESDAVYVTGVSCSVLNTPPIDRRCFADAADEMEDEEEGPHEWWDEQELGPPVLQAELEREGIGESTVRQWRVDEKYLNYDPYKEHGRFLLDVEKSTTIANEEKEATLSHYSDYGKCRVTVYINLRHHMEREVSMEYVPDHLALNPDGTRFLQYQTADMHIYYSEKIIRKACENGLDTLIAGGIFSMHPNQREKNGQLYTIHGVCNGKVNVPLLYAITNKKTEFIYTKIWTMLKEVIDSTTDHDFNPRILLDFERASIKAAKRYADESDEKQAAFAGSPGVPPRAKCEIFWTTPAP
ncbi:unnamed protein product [Heligmosomoides polygyrus]|uniref:MULE domain-containing protein n=1 Tax=Heligmosomoides polygyrus TaxID=6339 RepID=A0A3P8C7D4_HELPZ|nr:unnamed protein product [Heligmosomoides polygyrus]